MQLSIINYYYCNYHNYLPIGKWPLGWHTWLTINLKFEIKNVPILMQDCSRLPRGHQHYFALFHAPTCLDFYWDGIGHVIAC